MLDIILFELGLVQSYVLISYVEVFVYLGNVAELCMWLITQTVEIVTGVMIVWMVVHFEMKKILMEADEKGLLKVNLVKRIQKQNKYNRRLFSIP